MFMTWNCVVSFLSESYWPVLLSRELSSFDDLPKIMNLTLFLHPLKEEKGVFNRVYFIPAISPQSSHSVLESLSGSTSAEKRIVAYNHIDPHKNVPWQKLEIVTTVYHTKDFALLSCFLGRWIFVSDSFFGDSLCETFSVKLIWSVSSLPVLHLMCGVNTITRHSLKLKCVIYAQLEK